MCLSGDGYTDQQSLSAYAIHILRNGKTDLPDSEEGYFEITGQRDKKDGILLGNEDEEAFFAVAEKADADDYDYDEFEEDEDIEKEDEDIEKEDEDIEKEDEDIEKEDEDIEKKDEDIEKEGIKKEDIEKKADSDWFEQPDFSGGQSKEGEADLSNDYTKDGLDLEKLGNIVEKKDSDGSTSKKKDNKSSSGKKSKNSSSKKNKKPWLHPKWTEVGEDYFKDAVFIGDSRQQGFGLYSKLPDITVYAQKGFQIYTAATKRIVETPFGNITIGEALKVNKGKFKKVYLMFGLNEMGWGTPEKLDAYYYNLIDYIKETQPDAIIYLECIIHVTDKKAKSNYIFSNEAIDLRNKHLKKIAEDEHIYYLDLNEIFTDENNALWPDAAADGVHMKAEYIEKWKEYLMSHAIKPHKKKSDDSDKNKDKGKEEDKEEDKEELSYEDRLRELFGIGPGGSSIDAISGEGMKLMGLDPNMYYQGADGNVYPRFTGPGFDEKNDDKNKDDKQGE